MNRVSGTITTTTTTTTRIERVEKAGLHCVRVNRVSEEVNYETMGQFFFGEFSAIWILCLFLCPFRNLGKPILPIQKFSQWAPHQAQWACTWALSIIP